MKGAAASATGGAAAMIVSSAVIFSYFPRSERQRWQKEKDGGLFPSPELLCCPRSLVRERATDVLAHARRGR